MSQDLRQSEIFATYVIEAARTRMVKKFLLVLTNGSRIAGEARYYLKCEDG